MKFLGIRHQGRAGFVSASAVAALLAAPLGVRTPKVRSPLARRQVSDDARAADRRMT